MAEIPASIQTVRALQAEIEERIGTTEFNHISLAAPDRSRVVALERNELQDEKLSPEEYYPVQAVIQQTLKGSPIFPHGRVSGSSTQKDKTYIIFERGDKQVQVVVEINKSTQQMLGEEETQILRRYVASLQQL